MPIFRKLLIFNLLLFSSACAVVDSITSNLISPDNILDSGLGSLREAILNAQEGAVLIFPPTMSGTIVLQSPLPDIAKRISIIGPTEGTLVIDGSSTYQMFTISGSFPSISNLHLSNGATTSGGVISIQSNAALALSNVTVTHDDNAFEPRILLDKGATLRSHDLRFSNPEITSKDHIYFQAESTHVLDSDTSIQPIMVVDGSPSYVKQNDGTVTFYTLSTMDAPMRIDEGTLIFNGKTKEQITVLSHGTLRGSSSCASLVNLGTVKPGNSVGTITISGDYIQTGTLEIQLEPSGGSDLLQIGGNAKLDGPLVFNPQSGVFFKGETFTFLDAAGTITGTFTSVSSTFDGIDYALQYFPHSIQVEILKNAVLLISAQCTGNMGQVLDVLEEANVTRGSDLFTVLAAINALDPPNDVASALDQLDLVPFLSIPWSEATTLYQLSNAIARQQFSHCSNPSCCPPRQQSRLWISPIAERIDQETVQSLIGFRTYSGGMLVGYDRDVDVGAPLTLGAVGAYTYSHLSWEDSVRSGTAHINGYYASGYGCYSTAHLSVDASLMGSIYQNDIHRTISFPGVHRIAKSTPMQYGVLGHLGFHGFVPCKGFQCVPFGRIDYLSLWQSGFEEHGAKDIDLRVRANRTGFIHAEAGVAAERTFCPSWGTVVPALSLSWVFFGPISGTQIVGQFVSIPQALHESTSDHAFNAVSPMATVGFIIGDAWRISLRYKGEFSSRRNVQDVNVSLRWQF